MRLTVLAMALLVLPACGADEVKPVRFASR